MCEIILSYFNIKQRMNNATASSVLLTGRAFRFATCSVLLMALMSAAEVAQAKDNSVNGKQLSPRTEASVNVQGKVRGLERARKRSDGVIIVPGHFSGKGKVVADHIVLEGIVSPGNSPGCIDFSGDVTFSSTATLIMELGGMTPCSEYDQLNVANTLTINNAAFELVLINVYMPQFGDSFDVLNWGSLSGSGFGSIDTSAATLPYPLQWDLSKLELTGEVVVGVQPIANGDLAPIDNPDGFINAADLLIATQITLGQREAGALQIAHGDMNGDAVIDIVDLQLIQKIVLQNQ